MEEILSALAALLFWRVILSTVGAIALALVLANNIPPFTAEYSITLVILGIAFGVYWQGRAEAHLSIAERVEEPKISRPVVFLGLALIGLICGVAFATLFNSKLFGTVALFVGAASVAAWYRYVQRHPFNRCTFAFALVSMLAGYAVLLLSVWVTP